MLQPRLNTAKITTKKTLFIKRCMKEPLFLILKKRQKEHNSVLFVGMGPKKVQKCLGTATHSERVEAIWRTRGN